MKKHKTYGYWISVCGATLLVVQLVCDYFGVKFDVNWANQLVASVCGVLVVAGILVKDKTSTDELKIDFEQSALNALNEESNKPDEASKQKTALKQTKKTNNKKTSQQKSNLNSEEEQK